MERGSSDTIHTVSFPIRLNGDYTCQGIDAEGNYCAFDDLLTVGDRVASASDEHGNQWAPMGIVVQRSDGLWIEAEDAA